MTDLTPSIVIRYTDRDGKPARLGPMTRMEAGPLLAEILGGLDPDATWADLLGDLRRRLPVGVRVRHATRELFGAVVEDDGAGAPGRAAAGRTAYSITHKAVTYVAVRWDDGTVGWYVSDWIAKLAHARQPNPRMPSQRNVRYGSGRRPVGPSSPAVTLCDAPATDIDLSLREARSKAHVKHLTCPDCRAIVAAGRSTPG
ncbi:hypothetical protein [Actinoallomurus sp. CA-142502]|uniref:hypothetical protein n=1 Tax=Actinoallomurus sp. CA-142502 TaxID=3239885 RepID=UPI003D89F75E